MKIGVLSNPVSRRNITKLGKFREFINQHDDVVHRELTDFGALKSVLNDFAAAGIELLVINAGDGTVSAVLTEIFELGENSSHPKLAILPGGTSNTIAADVGLRGNRVASLRRLFSVVGRGEVEQHCVSRPLIRVEYDPARRAVCGMFFGTAAICDAITLRRQLFPQRWIPDPLAGALTLGYVLSGVLFSRSQLLRGHAIAIDLDAVSEPETRLSLVMVTTLHQIFLGSSPFWGDGEGRLKYTSIRSPADGLVRHAYRILYGRDKERLPNAIYRSAAVDQIQLRMTGPFNLDGEFLQPAPDTPVTLTSPSTAQFVQC